MATRQIEGFPLNPLEQFDRWYSEAKSRHLLTGLARKLISKIFPATALFEPDAVSLATATPDAKPSLRMVLYKGQLDGGFVFYSNSHSRKGRELDDNPVAAMTFYWPLPPRQIRIEGKVKEIGYEKTAKYWSSRGRGSQVSAWASNQSHPIESREQFLNHRHEIEKQYAGKAIPCPEHWKGYVLIPHTVEFWEGRSDRAHQRVVYQRETDHWNQTLLAP